MISQECHGEDFTSPGTVVLSSAKMSGTAASILEKARARVQAKKQAEEKVKEKAVHTETICSSTIVSMEEPILKKSEMAELPNSKSRAREMLERARAKVSGRVIPAYETGIYESNERSRNVAGARTNPVDGVRCEAVSTEVADAIRTNTNDKAIITHSDDVAATTTRILPDVPGQAITVKAQDIYHGKYLASASKKSKIQTSESQLKEIQPFKERQASDSSMNRLETLPFSAVLLRKLYKLPSLVGASLRDDSRLLGSLSDVDREEIASMVTELGHRDTDNNEHVLQLSSRLLRLASNDMAAQNALGSAGVSHMIGQLLSRVVLLTSRGTSSVKEQYKPSLIMLLKSVGTLLICCEEQWHCHDGNSRILVNAGVWESIVGIVQDWLDYDDVVEQSLLVACYLLTRQELRSQLQLMDLYDVVVSVVVKYHQSRPVCLVAFTVLMHFLVKSSSYAASFMQAKLLDILVRDSVHCDESMGSVICAIIGILLEQDSTTLCISNPDSFECVKSLLRRFPTSEVLKEHASFALVRFAADEKWRIDISSTEFVKEYVISALRVNVRLEDHRQIYAVLAAVSVLASFSIPLSDAASGTLTDIFRKSYVAPIQGVVCLALHNMLTKSLCSGSVFAKNGMCALVTRHIASLVNDTNGSTADSDPVAFGAACMAVTALASCEQSNRLQFCGDGLCELLVEALPLYKNTQCCNSLLTAISSLCGNWTESEEVCVAKFLHGNAHAVILSLWEDSLEKDNYDGIQLAAISCTAVGKLCRLPQGMTDLSESVFPLALRSLQLYGDSPDVVTPVCWTAALLALSDGNCSEITEQNVAGAMCVCLQRHAKNEEVVIPCVTAICQMLKFNVSANRFGSIDMPELLKQIFERYLSDRAILLHAHQLLSILLSSDSMLEGIIYCNLHHRLVDGLKMFDEISIVEHICRSLALTLTYFNYVERQDVSQVLASVMQVYSTHATTFELLLDLGLKLITEDDGAGIQSIFGEADVCVLVVRNLGRDSAVSAFAVKNCAMLHALCANHDENVGRCYSVDICPIMVSVLQRARESNDALLASACGTAVSALVAKSNRTRNSLGTAGLAEVIVACLQHNWSVHDDTITYQLLLCLKYLSENTANACVMRLADSIVGRTFACVFRKHRTDSAIAAAAFAVIANQCSGDSEMKSFCDEGICHVVVDTLSQFENCESVLVQVFGAVAVLSRCPEIVQMFEEKCVYKICVQLLRKHITSLSMCCDCANTITVAVDMSSTKELKTSRQNNWAALNVGDLLCEVGNRHVNDGQVFLAVCRSVCSIADNNDECALIMAACGSCEMLCKGMKMHSTDETVAAAGCGALASLAFHQISNKIKIEQCGGCDIVISLLVQHMQCAEVVQRACMATTALCNGCVANAFIFASKGAQEIVTEVLEYHVINSSVSETVSHAVAAISACDDVSRINVENACAAAAETLWQAITASDDAAILSSLSIVSSLSENNIMKQLDFGRLGLCEILTDMLRQQQRVYNDGVLLRAVNSLCRHGHEVTSYVSENVARFIAAGAAELVLLELQRLYTSPDVCMYGSSILYTFFSSSVSIGLGSIGMVDVCEILRSALTYHLRNAAVTELLCVLLELIFCNAGDMCASLVDIEAVTSLVDAFRLHSMKAISERAAFSACEALSTLLEYASEGVAQQVEATEFSILLAHIMDEKRANPSFAALGCLTVSRLLSASSTPQLLARFRQLGLCEVLVGVLHVHVAKVHICYNACEAIFSLSDGCVENQTRFGKAGVCAVLVDLVGRLGNDTNFCRIACNTICSLSSNHPQNKVAFGSAGACSALMHVVQSYIFDAGLIASAIMAVRNLTGCHENITLLRESDTFDIVSTLFLNHITTVEISEHCCAVLSNLITARAEFKNEIGDTRVCDACVAALFQDSLDRDACRMTCLLVANICGGHESNTRIIINKGLCEGLVHLLVTHSRDSYFVGMVCTVVSSFSGFDDCLRRCITQGLCRDVISALEIVGSFDQSVACEWCDAIAAMATCNSSVVVFLETNIVEKVQKLLKTYMHDPGIVRAVLHSQFYLFRFEALRPALTQYGALRCVLDAALENRSDSLVTDTALQLLKNVSATMGIDDQLDMIDANVGELILYAMQHFGNQEGIASICLDIIALLCSVSVRAQKLMSSSELCIQVFDLHVIHASTSGFICKYFAAVFALIQGNNDNAGEFLHKGIVGHVLEGFIDLSSEDHGQLCLLCKIITELSDISLTIAVEFMQSNVLDTVVALLQEHSAISSPNSASAEICENVCSVIAACSKISAGDAAISALGVRLMLVTTLCNYVSFASVCKAVTHAITSAIESNPRNVEDFSALDVDSALIAGLRLHIEEYDVIATMLCCVTRICDAASKLDLKPFHDVTKLERVFHDALELHQRVAIYVSVCDFIVAGSFKGLLTPHDSKLVSVVLKYTDSFIGNTAAVCRLCRMVLHVCSFSSGFHEVLITENSIALLVSAVAQNMTSAATVGMLCRALTAIAIVKPTSLESFRMCDGYTVMLSALRSSGMSSVLLDIGKTIQIYCHSNPSSVSFVTHGGFETLIELLDTYSNSRNAVLGICYALHSLQIGIHEHCKVDTAMLQGILNKIKTVHEHDGEVMGSLLCLYSLASLQNTERDDDSVRTCKALMSSLSANVADVDVLQQTLRGTITLVQDNVAAAEYLGGSNFCRLLSDIITAHPKPTHALTEELFLAMHHLCMQSPGNASELRELGIEGQCFKVLASGVHQHSPSFAVCCVLEDIMPVGDFRADLYTAENIMLIYRATQLFLVSKPDMCGVPIRILCKVSSCGTDDIKTASANIFAEFNCKDTLTSLLQEESASAATICSCFTLFYCFGEQGHVVSSATYPKLCPLIVSHLNSNLTCQDICECSLCLLDQLATNGNPVELAATLEENVCSICVRALKLHSRHMKIVEKASSVLLLMVTWQSFVLQDDTAVVILECLEAFGHSSVTVAEHCMGLFVAYFSRSSGVFVRQNQLGIVFKSFVREFGKYKIIVERVVASIVASVKFGDDFAAMWTEIKMHEMLLPLLRDFVLEDTFAIAACSYITCFSKFSTSDARFLGELGACEITIDVMRRLRHTRPDIFMMTMESVKELCRGDPQLSDKFGSLGCCDIIAEYLSSLTEQTQSEAIASVAETIWLLCENCVPNKEMFADGSLPVNLLSWMAKWEKEVTTARMCCGALRHLVLNCPKGRDTFSSLKASDRVEHVMKIHHKSEDISRLGCGALWALSIHDSTESEKASSSSLRTLLDTITEHLDDAQVVIFGCVTLSNLCIDDASALMLGSSGACDVVYSALRGHRCNCEVATAGCDIISKLCVNPGNSTRLYELGVLQVIYDLAVNHNCERGVCIAALTAMWSVVAGVEDRAVELMEFDMTSVVMNTFKQYPKCFGVHESVLRLVNCLIELIPALNALFGNVGICEVAVAALKFYATRSAGNSTPPVANTIRAVCSLCRNARNMTRLVIVGLFESLELTLKLFSNIKEVPCYGAKIIQLVTDSNVLQREQYQDALGEDGICEVLVSALNLNLLDSETVVEILRGLIGICLGHSRNIFRVHTCGGISGLFAVLEIYGQTNAVISRSACGLIVVLNADPSCAETCGKLGLCDLVVDTFAAGVQNRDVDAIETMCYAMVSLVRGNAMNQAAIGRHSGIAGLLPSVLSGWARESVSAEEAAIWVISLLCRHSKEETSICVENMEILSTLGCLSSVTATVLRHIRHIDCCLAGAQALCNLSSSKNAEALSQLGGAGGCEAIVGIIRQHISHISCIEVAVCALANMSSSPDNIRLFQKMNIGDVVIELCQRYEFYFDIMVPICRTCRYLATDKVCFDQFSAANIYRYVIDMFVRDTEAERESFVGVLECLKSVLQSREGCYSMPCDGVSIVLVNNILAKWIPSHDYDIIHLTCSILKQVLECGSDQSLVEVQLSLCGALQSILKDCCDSADVVCVACDVTRLLSLRSNDCTQYIAKLGIQDSIVSIMNRMDQNLDVAQTAALTLQTILTDGSTRNDMALRSTCDVVLKSLRRHSDDRGMMERNCAALYQIANKGLQHISVLIEMGCCEILVSILRKHGHVSSLLIQAMLVLECICQSESAVLFMGGVGMCEAVVGAFRRHVGADMPVTTSFLKIIECLSEGPDSRASLGLCGCCEIVSSILSSAIEEKLGNVVTSCARSIRLLCTDNPTNAESFGMSGVCVTISTAITRNNELSTLDSLLLAARYLCQQDDLGTMTNQFNTEAFKNSLIDKVCIQLFKKCTHSESTTIAFLLVLHSLSSDPESMQTLYEMGACELIVSVINQSSDMASNDLLASIVPVLECYAADATYASFLLKNSVESFVIRLYSSLNDYSEVTIQRCFNIVTSFSEQDKKFVELFVRSGVCGQIINVVHARQNMSASMVASLGAVTEVFSSEKRIITELEDSRAGELYLKAWKSHEGESATVLALARAVLVLTSSAVLSSQFLEDGGYDLLVKCIRRFMTNVAIVTTVMSIVAQILCLKDDTSPMELFFQAGGSEILLAVLRRYSENPEILAKCCLAFSVLALDDDVSGSLGSGGACEGSVNAINMFDNDVRVVQYGCKAIRNMAVLSTNRALFMAHEATQYIVAALRRFVHTEKVVIEACGALVNLYGDNAPESASQRSVIVGAAIDLVKVLNVQVDSIGVLEKMFTLLKLLATDDRSREILGAHDICGSIPVALQKHIHVPIVIERGLGAVSKISFRSVQNKMLFSDTNICQLVMSIICHYAENVKLLELCCITTSSLCTSCDKNIEEFVKHGLCSVVEEMLTKHSENLTLCSSICQTVARLCKLDSALKRFDDGNISKLICHTLQRHIGSATLTKNSCDALRCLGITVEHIDKKMEPSVSAALVKCVISYTSDGECMVSIMAASANLATHSANMSSRLGDDGMCEALLLALEENKGDFVTSSTIIKALFALSGCLTNIPRFATSAAYGLLATCMRAYSSDHDFSMKCCGIITNVTTTEQSRNNAALAGICESVARVFELYEGDRDIVTAAAIATSSVAQNNTANAERCAKIKLCLMIFRAIETHMHSSDTVAALLLAVSSLASTVLNRRFFGGGDGCELVKIALLKNISCRSVCSNAATAVAAISTNSFENKETYGKIGMIDILAKNIRNYKESGEVVSSSCKTMNILCTEHPENAERTSRESVAELLVGALRFHMSENTVVEEVLNLLIGILQQKQTYVEILKTLNVRELLIELINRHNNSPVTLMYVVRFLRDVYASEEDTNSIDPITNECLYLTNALGAHSSDMIITEDLCGIAFLISRKRLSRSVSLFGDCGACPLISDALRFALLHRNMSLAKMALLALVSLCAGSASNQAKFGESGACAAVVSILKDMGGSSSVLCIDMEGAALNAIAMLVRHGKLKSSENEKNMLMLLDEGVCEIVAGCLDKRLDNMPLVYSACRSIFCLASNDSCCSRFIHCGAGDLVVRVLRSYQSFPSIVQYAVGAVANLGYAPAGAHSLHVHGICDVLVKTFSMHKKDSQIAQHGCNAIKNLSVEDADIRATLGSAGACKVLLSVLKFHGENHSVLCTALFAIANMIIDIPVHAETFMQAQIDQKLFKFVDENITAELVCSSAFAVIGNLCDHEFTKRGIIDADICRLIAKVVRAHLQSDTIVVRCFVSLVRLNGHEQQASVLLSEDKELCELVVNILKVHRDNDVIVDVACKVLVSLGKCSEYNRSKLIESGAAEQAILILSKHSSVPICVAQVCRAVVFLACDSRSQGLLSELGICDRIVTMLGVYSIHDEMAQLLADAASALAANCASNATELAKLGIISRLLDSFRSHSSSKAVGRCICHALDTVLRHSTEFASSEEVCRAYSITSVYFQQFWADSHCSESVCQLICCLSLVSDFKPVPRDIIECLALAYTEHVANRSLTTLCLDTATALITNDKELSGILGTPPVCQHVVSVLRTYAADVDVVTTVLKTVAFLSIDQDVRARLGEFGVCDAIASIFRKHVSADHVLDAGLSAVRVLASNTPANKAMLGECGFCELIVEVLKFGFCSSKQVELALAAVANMTNDPNSSNVSRLDNAGVITCLVDIFQNHIGSPAIVKQACIVIKHLAADASGPHKKLGEMEICDKVCLALAMHLGIDRINLVLCSCVRALAQDASNKLLLGECGACNIASKVLDMALENEDTKLLEEVLLMVIALICGSSANQDAAGKAGICELICHIVRGSYGAAIDEKCLWCAAYLCRSGLEGSTTNEENIHILMDGGLLRAIGVGLTEYIENVNIILPACWALRNSCFLDTHAIAVLKTTVFCSLCSVVQRHILVLGVCEAACYAMSTILAVDHNESLESSGVCELIVQTLRRHINSPSVTDRCCSVMANISSLGRSYRQRLFNEGACAIIVRALKIHIRLGTAVEEACGAVWNMSMESMECRESFGNEGACEIIVDSVRIHHGNVYVRTAGIGALKALVVDNDYNLKRVQACGVQITNVGEVAVSLKGEMESPTLMRE